MSTMSKVRAGTTKSWKTMAERNAMELAQRRKGAEEAMSHSVMEP